MLHLAAKKRAVNRFAINVAVPTAFNPRYFVKNLEYLGG
jgi:hypothetical protein